MTKKPQVRSTVEALRLADDLDRNCEMGWPDYDTQMGAATELRRLHEVNQELLEALQRIKHHFDTDEYAWKIAEAAIAKAGEHMTKQTEALKLALEALQRDGWKKAGDAIRALEEALAEQPAQQEPVVWKLVPTEPTEEMLKAMDECSKEGYDERLYAGHAASVYMAAVDAAPTPPAQQEPVAGCVCRWNSEGDRVVTCERHQGWLEVIAEWAERARDAEKKLKALNTSPPAQRTWVGLTDEEITDIWAESSPYYHEDDFARAIEAKLKEKNT